MNYLAYSISANIKISLRFPFHMLYKVQVLRPYKEESFVHVVYLFLDFVCSFERERER